MPSTLKLGAYFLSMEIQSTQVCISLKSLFSRHKGIGVQFTDEPTGALDSKAARMLLDSMETMNVELNATILMVTHDAFTASYCKRILFIKDGKIFNELVRGNDSRKRFFDRIIEVVTLLGGDSTNVF